MRVPQSLQRLLVFLLFVGVLIALGVPLGRILLWLGTLACIALLFFAAATVRIRTGVTGGLFLAAIWALVAGALNLSLTRILAGVAVVGLALVLFVLFGPVGVRLCDSQNRMWRSLRQGLRPGKSKP